MPVAARDQATRALRTEYCNPYAVHYDALHQQRDVAADCRRILALLEFTPAARDRRRLLDFGCGTGSHAIMLAESGLRVVGADSSAGMIAVAAAKRRDEPLDLRFVHGSSSELLRHFAPGHFHGAISLFNVFNCMDSAGEAQSHLDALCTLTAPGGRLLVELWHGDAVLRGEPRSKTLKVTDPAAPHVQLVQTLSPTLDKATRRITLHYAVTVRDGIAGTWESFEEIQVVRFMTTAQYERLFEAAGLRVAARFPTGRPEAALTADDWFVTYVLVRP